MSNTDLVRDYKVVKSKEIENDDASIVSSIHFAANRPFIWRNDDYETWRMNDFAVWIRKYTDDSVDASITWSTKSAGYQTRNFEDRPWLNILFNDKSGHALPGGEWHKLVKIGFPCGDAADSYLIEDCDPQLLDTHHILVRRPSDARPALC